jgi:hypothetical protein
MPNETTETPFIPQFAAFVEESRRGNACLDSVRNKRGLNQSFPKYWHWTNGCVAQASKRSLALRLARSSFSPLASLL